MHKPMNPDVKPGAMVSGYVKAAVGEEVGILLSNEQYRIFNDSGVLYTLDDDGDRITLYSPGKIDLTGLVEVIPEKKKMTVREVSVHLNNRAQVLKVDVFEACLTAAILGKSEFERLASEKLGYDIEIVEGE